MNRRFVNLVTHKWAEGFYTLRRIDPSHLFFYRSANAALEAADEAAKRNESFPEMQTLELPPSTMNFSTNPTGRLDIFALLSSRPAYEGAMIFANTTGKARLYDADRHLFAAMGSLKKPKGLNPVCLSIVHPGTNQDSLYVMGRCPGQTADGCFEVLEFAPELPPPCDMDPAWRWRILPPPPFVRQPWNYQLSSVISYTTILDSDGYSTIYVSCDGGVGTYSFETARRDSSRRGWKQSEEWTHVGEWMFPFNGRAQYVPEFNLWFGFSASSPNNLCAADLSAMDADRQPTVQQEWQDVNPPEGEVWLPTRLKLLNLGDGKFLIAKTLEAEATRERFAVFTGVQMMHDVGGDGKRLQMVKHKCACFAFRGETIYWVL